MAVPRFEVPMGLVNGVNVTFTLSRSYIAGTLAAFLNGQLKRADYDDGWIELSPTAGTYSYKQAPMLGDVPQAFYIDSTTVDEVLITAITGILTATDDLSGHITPSDLVGTISMPDPISATLMDLTPFLGTVDDTDVLKGFLSC